MQIYDMEELAKQRDSRSGQIKSIAAVLFVAVIAALAVIRIFREGPQPAATLDSAAALYDQGRWDLAAEEYIELASQGAIITSEDSARAARSLARAGRRSEAAAAYELYLADSSDDMIMTTELGVIYSDIGRSADAIEVLERASDHVPEAIFRLGLIYEASSDDDRAADAFARYVERSADAESLLAAGRSLMRAGRYRDALAGFTAADAMLPSDDKRGFHAVNAAKNMLGWPTDDSLIITPGISIGALTIGMTREEAIRELGEPIYMIDEDTHSVWGYSSGTGIPDTVAYFDEDALIEIVTQSTSYATADGLGLGNFREPKYSNRFTRMRDPDAMILRYTLRGGGLAFYVGDPMSRERVRAVVYSGTFPLTEHLGASWIYFWD